MYEMKEAIMNGEENKKRSSKKAEVRIAEKVLLTIEEAAAYTGLGMNKLRLLSEDENCPFVLWNGSKRLLKRVILEKYLLGEYSI